LPFLWCELLWDFLNKREKERVQNFSFMMFDSWGTLTRCTHERDVGVNALHNLERLLIGTELTIGFLTVLSLGTVWSNLQGFLLVKVNREWVFVYRHWCEENEMVFVSHEVPFPATSDRRSRVAGNGTEWEVKTIELSSSTSGGEQWAFLNFIILTAVKKTVPKLRKVLFRRYFAFPLVFWIFWGKSGGFIFFQGKMQNIS